MSVTVDPAKDRGWRNRSLVREPDAQQKRSLWHVLLALIVALSPTTFYMVQQNECLKISYELEELRSERERLVREEQRLRIDRASLESLTSIEEWAVHHRGLRRPGSEQVIVVTEEVATLDRMWARSGTISARITTSDPESR